MGTEVLRPQDCLVSHAPALRRPNYPNPNPNPNCSPSSNPSNPSARTWRRAATYGGRRRWDGSAKRRGGGSGAGRPQQAAARKADGGWDAAASGAGRLGPDRPSAIPKGLRLRAAAEGGGDAYAGTAVVASPSPRALPLPRFPRRSEAAEEEEATRALRRLLRLE